MLIEPKIQGYIIAQLRRIFKWTNAYKRCKLNALIDAHLYRCDGCEQVINKKGLDQREMFEGQIAFKESMAVDHINPVSPTEGSYIILTNPSESLTESEAWCRLIIERVINEDLQYLCQCCHYVKTQIENEERRDNKKLLKELKDD
jgi:hypothetical protein